MPEAASAAQVPAATVIPIATVGGTAAAEPRKAAYSPYGAPGGLVGEIHLTGQPMIEIFVTPSQISMPQHQQGQSEDGGREE